MKRNHFLSDKVIIDKLEILIDQHFKTTKSREFYCRELGHSLLKMNDLCAQYRNMTLFQMLQARMLNEAKSLLLDTDLSVKEITFVLGFNDQAYFGRFMKRWTGFAPQEFRNAMNLGIGRFNL